VLPQEEQEVLLPVPPREEQEAEQVPPHLLFLCPSRIRRIKQSKRL